jgi:hypothetical protein
MSLPSGVQWEWAIGEFAVLGFLIWELVRLRRTQRRDRERARLAEGAPRTPPADGVPVSNGPGGR